MTNVIDDGANSASLSERLIFIVSTDRSLVHKNVDQLMLTDNNGVWRRGATGFAVAGATETVGGPSHAHTTALIKRHTHGTATTRMHNCRTRPDVRKSLQQTT